MAAAFGFFIYLHPLAVPSLLPVRRPPGSSLLFFAFLYSMGRSVVTKHGKFFVVWLVRKVALVKLTYFFNVIDS
jgi:hypothetical protein